MGKDAIRIVEDIRFIVDSKMKWRFISKKLRRKEDALKREAKRLLGRHDRWSKAVVATND